MSERGEIWKAKAHARRMGIVCLCDWYSYMVGSGCERCNDPNYRAGTEWAARLLTRRALKGGA